MTLDRSYDTVVDSHGVSNCDMSLVVVKTKLRLCCVKSMHETKLENVRFMFG